MMPRRGHAVAATLALLTGAIATTARARVSITPPELKGVDIVEHLNESVPLDATFTDEDGNTVKLGDYFKKDRPVILQLGYLRCPMLCNLVLNGTFAALKEVDWSAGDSFDIVSISLNPTEPHELARAKRDQYAVEYARPGAAKGIHFLVAPGESKRVADSVGFKFNVQDNGEISHAAAIFLITPAGKISRYFYRAQFEPKDMHLGLLEASEGKIGSTWDRFILWCHVYQVGREGNRYVIAAKSVMKLGGGVMLLILVGGVIILARQNAKSNNRAHKASAANPQATA